MTVKIIKFTLNQLMLSKSHIGSNLTELNSKMIPYLLGKRKFINIINLKYTGIQLKKIIFLIINLISLRQKILFIKNFRFPYFINYFKIIRCFYVDNFWIKGLLTNYKIVSNSKKLRSNPNYNSNIFSMKYLPSLVIFLQMFNKSYELNECLHLKIPVVGILDTNTISTDNVNYIIPTNSTSVESLYIYIYIYKSAIIQGLHKERFDILSLI